MNCFYSKSRGYDDKFISLKVCNWNETVGHEHWTLNTLIHFDAVRWFNWIRYSILATRRVSSVHASESVDLAVSTFPKSYLFDCEWWNRLEEYCGRHLIPFILKRTRIVVQHLVACSLLKKHFDNNRLAVNVRQKWWQTETEIIFLSCFCWKRSLLLLLLLLDSFHSFQYFRGIIAAVWYLIDDWNEHQSKWQWKPCGSLTFLAKIYNFHTNWCCCNVVNLSNRIHNFHIFRITFLDVAFVRRKHAHKHTIKITD